MNFGGCQAPKTFSEIANLKVFKYISGKIRSRNLSSTLIEAYLGFCNYHHTKKLKFCFFVGCGPQKPIAPKSTFYHKSVNIFRKMPCNTCKERYFNYLQHRKQKFKKFLQKLFFENFRGFRLQNPQNYIFCKKNFFQQKDKLKTFL